MIVYTNKHQRSWKESKASHNEYLIAERDVSSCLFYEIFFWRMEPFVYIFATLNSIDDKQRLTKNESGPSFARDHVNKVVDGKQIRESDFFSLLLRNQNQFSIFYMFLRDLNPIIIIIVHDRHWRKNILLGHFVIAPNKIYFIIMRTLLNCVQQKGWTTTV